MSDLQFHWRIPIHGDKGDIASPHYTRGTWGPQTSGNQAPTVLLRKFLTVLNASVNGLVM